MSQVEKCLSGNVLWSRNVSDKKWGSRNVAREMSGRDSSLHAPAQLAMESDDSDWFRFVVFVVFVPNPLAHRGLLYLKDFLRSLE